MNDSIIAKRYGRALFKLGEENNRLDTYYQQVKGLQTVIDKVENFRFLLNNPIIAINKKREIIDKLFSGKIHNDILNFLKLLVKKNREIYLEDIFRAFISMHQEHANIQPVELTTAIEFDQQTIEKIRTLIDQITGKSSEIKTQTEKELIGGFIIRIGDKQLDASVQGKLNSIKKQLLN